MVDAAWATTRLGLDPSLRVAKNTMMPKIIRARMIIPMIKGIEEVHDVLDFLPCSSVTSGEDVIVSSGLRVSLSAVGLLSGSPAALIPVSAVSETPVLSATAVPVSEPLELVSGVTIAVVPDGVVAAGVVP